MIYKDKLFTFEKIKSHLYETYKQVSSNIKRQQNQQIENDDNFKMGSSELFYGRKT